MKYENWAFSPKIKFFEEHSEFSQTIEKFGGKNFKQFRGKKMELSPKSAMIGNFKGFE